MDSMSEKQRPAVDPEKAIDICGGDKDLFLKMAGEFVVEVKIHWEWLNVAMSTGDTDQVEEHAHAIKGICANIAAGPLMEISRRIEFAGKDRNMDRASSQLKKFDYEFKRVSDQLEKIIPPPEESINSQGEG